MKKSTKTQNTIKGLSLIAVGVLFLLPFFVLFWKVIFPLPEEIFTLKYFENIFSHSSTLLAIKNTIIISIGASIVSLIMALPLSWLLTRSNLPGANKWRSLFSLPYAIPPYIGAIAWIYLGNPTTGILNNFFGQGFINIYTYGGLIWVLSTFFYTFILLSLLSALDRMDPSLEEAARISGAGPIKVFLDVTLPIIRPSLLSGVLLVLLAAAASFGVPAMIGTPANIYMMTTRIYTFQKMGSLSGVYSAGGLSTILFLLAIGVLLINNQLNKQHFRTVGGKSTRPSVTDLKQFKWPIFTIMIISFIVLFLFPLIGILITSLSKIQGVLAWDNLGFQNFVKVFTEVDETPRALANSFRLAFSAASIASLWALILVFFQRGKKGKFNDTLKILVSLPYATPGTVLALAMVLTFGGKIFGLPISLYNTLTLIVIAYIAKYFSFTFNTLQNGIEQIDPCLEEAARVSGANWFTTLKTIWAPLLMPVLVSSWFLVFMPCFSELTMTVLLSGPGLETLGTLIFQLQEYSDASGGGAAVLALFTITLVAIINTLIKVISKGKYGL